MARVLARLQASPAPLTSTEIGRVLGYGSVNPASSVKRPLAQLEAAGLAEADRTDPKRTTWRAT
jgi:DNA-binding IclR family transcriptional regulator